MLKVSELLAGKLHPLIHGALISRIVVSKDNKFFAAVSSYQKSVKVEYTEFDFEDYTSKYIETLNSITGCDFWIGYEEYKINYDYCSFSFNGKEKALILIENDLKMNQESLFNRLYAKLFIDCPWFWEDNLNSEKKHFIRGFCELRGSIDTNRPLLAMDYFYENDFELGKARLLNEYLSVPYYIININFRELQEQYVLDVNKRNTQLRLQLNWYAKNIGFINEYKVKIIDKVYSHQGMIKRDNAIFINMRDIIPNGSDLFLKRLMHFSTKIFGKELNESDIAQLRAELGFDIDHYEVSSFRRNRDIIELLRLYTEDECAGCKNEYDIKDRTFVHKRTNRPYFEIHHNISLKNNADLDHEDNLVKLCPVCHAALKRGVGAEENQRDIIKNILNNQPNACEFAKHFFDTNDEKDIVNQIYSSLQ